MLSASGPSCRVQPMGIDAVRTGSEGLVSDPDREVTMSFIRRRQFVLGGAAATVVTVGATASPASGADQGRRRPFRPPAGPRYRLISDNDYSGDPDGLYQLVHHLLS